MVFICKSLFENEKNTSQKYSELEEDLLPSPSESGDNIVDRDTFVTDIVVRRKCTIGCLIISLIFNIVLITFCLLFLNITRLNCQKDNINNIYMFDENDNSEIKAAQSNSSVVKLIYIVLAAKHTVKYNHSDPEKIPNLSKPSVPRPAANLFLNTEKSKQGEKLRWSGKHKMSVSSVENNVRYTNGRLVVPKNGIYLVYNMITLKLQHQQEHERLIHKITIKREQNEKIREFERNQKVLYQQEVPRVGGELAFQMSDVMSIVKLKAGDALFVTISNLSAIYEESCTSVFGIYMMT